MHVHEVDHRDPGASRPVDDFSHLRLSDVTSVDEVLEVVASLDPAHRYLCTLDDLNQCCYTSAHAREDDRLWLDEDDDHARLRHVTARLDDPALRSDWTDLAGALATTPAAIAALATANREPDWLLDDVVYVQRVPVERDDLLIADLPNGYFTGDWDVFRNHAVIRRLHDAHGYRFFGIGASWLGFLRDEPPATTALIDDLVHLYGWRDEAAPSWRDLADLLRHSRTLFLGYTENFADTTAR